jgi:hypothetical protein
MLCLQRACGVGRFRHRPGRLKLPTKQGKLYGVTADWWVTRSLPVPCHVSLERVLQPVSDGVRFCHGNWTQPVVCAAVAGLQEMYLATMDAVDRVAPGTALFILQGPQQQAPAGYSQAQWGSGFSTEPGLLRLGSPGGDKLGGILFAGPAVAPMLQ